MVRTRNLTLRRHTWHESYRGGTETALVVHFPGLMDWGETDEGSTPYEAYLDGVDSSHRPTPDYILAQMMIIVNQMTGAT